MAVYRLLDVLIGPTTDRPAANNPYGGAVPVATAVYLDDTTGIAYKSTGSAWVSIGTFPTNEAFTSLVDDGSGNLSLTGTLAVSAAVTLSSTLHAVGAATLDAAASVAGLLTAAAGIKRSALAAKTADYPMVVTDDVILVGASSKIITLPSAITAGAGRVVTIKNKNFTGTTVKSAAGKVNDAAAGTGDTTLLANAYASASFISDATDWWSI